MERHSRRPGLLATFALVAALAILAAPPLFAQVITEHFLCYEATEETNERAIPATLDDQFLSPLVTEVHNALYFCNPAEKDGVDIVETTGHLTIYPIAEKLPAFKAKILVTNQLDPDPQEWKIVGPKYVAVPTLKNTTPVTGDVDALELILSHFTCYEASGKRLKVSPEVSDQFIGPVEVLVHVPQIFCDPAEKTIDLATDVVTPIVADEQPLACYKITPSEAPDKADSTPTIRNQFETDTLKIGPWKWLCVPSVKTHPS